MAAINRIKLKNGTYLDLKDSRIPGIDSAPTSGSTNAVTSGGVYTAIQNAGGGGSDPNAQKTYDSYPSSGELKEGDIYESPSFEPWTDDLVNTGEEGWGSVIEFNYYEYGQSQSVSIYDGSTLVLTAQALSWPPDAIDYIRVYDAGGNLVASGTSYVLYNYEVQDGLTVTSATNNQFLHVRTGETVPTRYEIFNGGSYPRKPNVELVHDAVNLPTAQSTSSALSDSFSGVFDRKFIDFSNDEYRHIPFIDFTDSETKDGDDYDVRHCIFEVGGYKYDVANHDYDGSWGCTVTASGGGGSATAITSQEIATIWTTVMG